MMNVYLAKRLLLSAITVFPQSVTLKLHNVALTWGCFKMFSNLACVMVNFCNCNVFFFFYRR